MIYSDIIDFDVTYFDIINLLHHIFWYDIDWHVFIFNMIKKKILIWYVYTILYAIIEQKGRIENKTKIWDMFIYG